MSTFEKQFLELDNNERWQAIIDMVEGIAAQLGMSAADLQRAGAADATAPIRPSAQTPSAIDADIGSVTFEGHVYAPDLARLALAATVANAAIARGVQGGDLRWFSAADDFTQTDIDGVAVPMDAQTVINFAAAAAA